MAARKRVADNTSDIKFEVATLADVASDHRLNLALPEPEDACIVLASGTMPVQHDL
jgi:hypothetical protein